MPSTLRGKKWETRGKNKADKGKKGRWECEHSTYSIALICLSSSLCLLFFLSLTYPVMRSIDQWGIVPCLVRGSAHPWRRINHNLQHRHCHERGEWLEDSTWQKEIKTGAKTSRTHTKPALPHESVPRSQLHGETTRTTVRSQ